MKRVHLIAAGKYHDIDFARLELLKLLAERPEVRTTAAAGYGDGALIEAADLLITYTCDLVSGDASLEQGPASGRADSSLKRGSGNAASGFS